MVHVRSYAMRLKVEDEEGLERESRRGEAADGKGSPWTAPSLPLAAAAALRHHQRSVARYLQEEAAHREHQW